MINARSKSLIPDKIKRFYLSLLDPFVNIAHKYKIHPNTLTTAGFILCLVSVYFMLCGYLHFAAAVFLVSGILDNIDGKLARKYNQASKFGALYDSTLDRYSDLLFLLSISVFFLKKGLYSTSAAAAFALCGSMLVSYIKARAEGLGYNCGVGILQREERIVLLGVSGIFSFKLFIIAVWAVAVLANFTALQRLIYVWKQDKNNETPKNSERKKNAS